MLELDPKKFSGEKEKQKIWAFQRCPGEFEKAEGHWMSVGPKRSIERSEKGEVGRVAGFHPKSVCIVL